MYYQRENVFINFSNLFIEALLRYTAASLQVRNSLTLRNVIQGYFNIWNARRKKGKINSNAVELYEAINRTIQLLFNFIIEDMNWIELITLKLISNSSARRITSEGRQTQNAWVSSRSKRLRACGSRKPPGQLVGTDCGPRTPSTSSSISDTSADPRKKLATADKASKDRFHPLEQR